ncbi:hypothetical protein P9112_001101 [Eukaryota sp. TZLM1-RC]
MCDSTSSALVTTIPQVYGTLLSDSAWTLNMRFRSFIWPDNLPHNLICKCSREITTTHLLNCKHFITFRSKVHDAVRDQLYCMCKSHRIESFLEPLLSNLFDAENDFHKNNRGDVILPGLDGSFILLDVMSVDPCNASNERLVNSEIHNPLSNAENFKFKKYNEPLSKLASLQHAKYNLYPFVFSLFGSLAPTALRFLDDFEMIVKRRTGRNFNRLFWQIRIVFSIFKGMLKMVSDALLSLGSHYERVASSMLIYRFRTARISCIKEPLLKETLSLNNFGSDDRGDVYCDWIDNSEAIVDFVSCNVANDTLVHRRKLNPVAALDFKAKEKYRKYDKEIEDANIDRNTQLVFIAFPFSINGRLSVEAETFWMASKKW